MSEDYDRLKARKDMLAEKRTTCRYRPASTPALADEEMDEILARCEKATPDLILPEDGTSVTAEHLVGPIAEFYIVGANVADRETLIARAQANAQFYFHARTDIPRLAARVREAGAEAQSAFNQGACAMAEQAAQHVKRKADEWRIVAAEYEQAGRSGKVQRERALVLDAIVEEIRSLPVAAELARLTPTREAAEAKAREIVSDVTNKYGAIYPTQDLVDRIAAAISGEGMK